MMVMCFSYAFRFWCLSMFKDVHNVGDMLLCTRVIFNFSMARNEINLKNVRGINETIALDMNTIPSHNL